jgi:hypothetical protein
MHKINNKILATKNIIKHTGNLPHTQDTFCVMFYLEITSFGIMQFLNTFDKKNQETVYGCTHLTAFCICTLIQFMVKYASFLLPRKSINFPSPCVNTSVLGVHHSSLQSSTSTNEEWMLTYIKLRLLYARPNHTLFLCFYK